MGLDEKIENKVLETLQKAAREGKLKETKFRYPFGKRVGKGQKKKNYITVIIPYENSYCDFKKYRIENQSFLHDEIPRLATAGHVMHDKKGNPILILPNWSVEPFSPLEHYKESMINGSNKKGYKILLDNMEMSKTDSKKKLGGSVKWIIGIVLGAIILYAIITGGAA
jgi:hypothetical protein